jgi:hypothetical protein
VVGGRGQRRETLLSLIGPRLASRHSTSLKNSWPRAGHTCGATLTFIDVRDGSRTSYPSAGRLMVCRPRPLLPQLGGPLLRQGHMSGDLDID